MERLKIQESGKIIQRLPQKTQDLRNEVLEELLNDQSWRKLDLFIYHQTENVISVGLRGVYYGMWLFDANDQSEVRQLKAAGCEIAENELDLILEGETATISEVEAKIPGFIKKYYPQLEKILPPKIKLRSFQQSSYFKPQIYQN